MAVFTAAEHSGWSAEVLVTSIITLGTVLVAWISSNRRIKKASQENAQQHENGVAKHAETYSAVQAVHSDLQHLVEMSGQRYDRIGVSLTQLQGWAEDHEQHAIARQRVLERHEKHLADVQHALLALSLKIEQHERTTTDHVQL